jgi:aryl-alcohol dehydrogenase-like predicted oxidoreductase
LKKYLNERGFRILAAVDQVASRLGSTPGKVALAWLMSRPSVTAPIASATGLAQLTELIDATRVQLDREAVLLLDQASV